MLVALSDISLHHSFLNWRLWELRKHHINETKIMYGIEKLLASLTHNFFLYSSPFC